MMNNIYQAEMKSFSMTKVLCVIIFTTLYGMTFVCLNTFRQDMSRGASTKIAPHRLRANSHFAIIRCIGNALPPRHSPEQTLSNLKFILENEVHFAHTARHWIVNHLVDSKLEADVVNLLKEYKESYTVVDFRLESYAKISNDYSPAYIGSRPDVIHREEYKKLPEEKMRFALEEAFMHDKINYITNLNRARNLMIEIGRTQLDCQWILPLDGNCFFTEKAWTETRSKLEEIEDGKRPGVNSKYAIIPMVRVSGDNAVLLDPNYEPQDKKEEEPQVAFHASSKEVFDPKLRYGRRNKVAFLMRLGVPGPWNSWPWEPWEKSMKPISNSIRDKKTGEKLVDAGWVARLSSGVSKLEVSGKSSERGQSRHEAMELMVETIDARVAREIYGWTSKTTLYYNFKVLEQEREIFKKTEHTKTPLNENVHNIITIAQNNIGQGPWSVVDKPKDSVAASNDPHDYYHPAPYFWPNPKDKDGPYIQKDGHRVPGTEMYGPHSECFDRSRLSSMFNNVTAWSLASFFTEESIYGEKAAEAVRTWFINPSTRMNPHLRYAQVVHGRNGNEGTNFGLIEIKDNYYFLDALRLLEHGGYLSEIEVKHIQDWYRELLKWLRNSKQGRTEYLRSNNHGLYYDITTASISAYIDDLSGYLRTIDRATSRMYEHIDDEGKLKHELARPNCEHYQMFTLQGWDTMARLARNVGRTYWSEIRNDSGLSKLCMAARYAIPWTSNRGVCKGNIHEENEMRWWPPYHSAKHFCREIITHSGPFLAQLPISKYSVPAMYFEHDGIAPFWNMGLKF